MKRRRVGAGATRWDELAQDMTAIDKALGITLQGRDGRIIGLVGEDWTPPATDATPDDHITYLERVRDNLTDALGKAKDLKEKAKQTVSETASKAADTAYELAQDIAKFPLTIVSSVEQKRLAAVQTGLKAAKVAAGAVTAATVGLVGFNAVALIVAAVLAYKYFFHDKHA